MDRDALIATLRREGITDETVLAAMSAVPRERFVDDVYLAKAWENHPLPIGAGQTISQPLVVAAMTAALGVGPGDVVLDVGTGSGYQAAVLAELGCRVWGIEWVPELAARASAVLTDVGLDVDVVVGDGRLGLPECAPFDAILVAAASETVPPALLDQLRRPPVGRSVSQGVGDSGQDVAGAGTGGRLVLPLADEQGRQRLVLITRTSTGFLEEELFGVRFVPLLGSDDPPVEWPRGE